jgi:hypothetical protein
MANNNITSANAVLILTVPLILPAPIQLVGFATRDIFTVSRTKPTETRMGVDGFFTGGFIYVEKPMTLSFNPASPSPAAFDAWNDGQETALIAAPAFMTVTLTGIGRTFNCNNGFLTGYAAIADAKETLQDRSFEITWGTIRGAPVGLSG